MFFFVLILASGLSLLSAQVTVTGRIVSNSNINVGIEGVVISFSGTSTHTATTNIGGQFTILELPAYQSYVYTASAQGFTTTSGTLQVQNSDIIMGDIILNEIAYPPHSVTASEGSNNLMHINWRSPSSGIFGFDDDFESYEDFSLDFGEWTLRDVDMAETYGYYGVDYPHYQNPMAFMIFNPENTIPPIPNMPAHSGSKFAASFATMIPPNNDWMITPLLEDVAMIRFWAKSYTSQYGLERFKVGVSTNSTIPQAFSIISGPGYIQAPTEWTEYVYDLSAYTNPDMDIYVGIQCVSNDAFIFMVDDIHAFGYISQNELQSSVQEKHPDRHLQGYKVWRMHTEDQGNEANWTALTPNTITATAYTDASWESLPMGVYRYAVKAVYSNNLLSAPAFSNTIVYGSPGTLQGAITDFDTGSPIEGVSIQTGVYNCSSNAQGLYSMQVYAGNHSISAIKEGYQTFTMNNVVIIPLQTTTLNISLVSEKIPPSNFSAFVQDRDVHLAWLPPNANRTLHNSIRSVNPARIDTRAVLLGYKIYRNGVMITQINDPAANSFIDENLDPGIYQYTITALYDIGESLQVSFTVNLSDTWVPLVLSEGFETYQDFSLVFAPWTLWDYDLSATVGIDGVQFPNSGSEMAFMIFNPGQTVPPLQDVYAYEGNKMAACFAAANSPNNDWLITPRIELQEFNSIRFFAKSYTSQYAAERFRLGVSTSPTANYNDFQIISGMEAVEVPSDWTEYMFDLSAFSNQQVYIGINCVSDSGLVLFVDKVELRVASDNYDNLSPEARSGLLGNYPNPFNPETTIRYFIKDSGPVTIEILNLKGQMVNRLVNSVKTAGEHSVVWNGNDQAGKSLPSGVYFYKLSKGNYSDTRKMIMLK